MESRVTQLLVFRMHCTQGATELLIFKMHNIQRQGFHLHNNLILEKTDMYITSADIFISTDKYFNMWPGKSKLATSSPEIETTAISA